MAIDSDALDDTFMLQVEGSDGSWQYYDGSEWATKDEAAEVGARIYGGEVTTRVVRVSREVVEVRVGVPRSR